MSNSRQNGSTFDFEKTSFLQHQIQQETYVSKQQHGIVMDKPLEHCVENFYWALSRLLRMIFN